MIVIDYNYLVKGSFKRSLGKEKWFYLGTDYKKIKILEKSFFSKDDHVDVCQELKTIQEEYKQKFIDFIGSLSVRYDSFEWWASSVSEKSMFEDQPLFIELCYFKLVKQFLNQDVIIVLDNLTLLKAVKANYNVITYIFRRNVIFNDLIKFLKSRAKVFIRHFFSRKDPASYKPWKKYFGLISWVDNRNTDSGSFEDSYFGKLFSSVKNNEDFLYVPSFLFKKHKDKAFAALKNGSVNFFSLFDNFTRLDVLKAFILSLGFNFRKHDEFIFDGEDVLLFIKQKFKNDWLSCRYAKYYLIYSAIKRLSSKGVLFDKIIYLFENQPWEKIVCYSLRKFYPEVKLVGFLHSVTLPYLLSLYPSNSERGIMPQPDEIFTTGKLFSDVLSEYYGQDKIHEACAFRYEYCLNKKFVSQNNKNVILVALSADNEKKAEMADKVYFAYKDKKEYRILIKDHPASPVDLKSIFINELPENFEIVNKPISELLNTSSIVINADSAVGLEALKCHIPVIEILFNLNSNMSPVDYFKGKKYSCLSSAEILDATDEIFNMSSDDKSKYFAEVDNFLAGCFNQIDDEHIKNLVSI